MTDPPEARRTQGLQPTATEPLKCPTCGYDGPSLYEDTYFQAERIAQLEREVAADRGLAPGEDFASFLVELHRQAVEEGPEAVAELAALHEHYAREAGRLDGPPTEGDSPGRRPE